MIFDIPTRPYLRKFIQHELGTQSIIVQAPFSNNTKAQHPIQLLIIALLKKSHDADTQNLKHTSPRYEASISIELSYFYSRQFGNEIPSFYIDLFNSVIQHMFEKSLYNFCQNYIQATLIANQQIEELKKYFEVKEKDIRKYQKKPQIKEALHLFCNLLNINIEYDITYENLSKKYYRYQKKTQPQPTTPGNTLKLHLPM